MAVEAPRKPGQGRVGGEVVARAAQKQRVGVAVDKPLDVLERHGALIGNVRRLAPNGDDEPDPVERPDLPSRASVASASLRQGVSRLSRIAGVGARPPAAGDFRFDCAAAPAAREAEIAARRRNRRSASGGLELTKNAGSCPNVR